MRFRKNKIVLIRYAIQFDAVHQAIVTIHAIEFRDPFVNQRTKN